MLLTLEETALSNDSRGPTSTSKVAPAVAPLEEDEDWSLAEDRKLESEDCPGSKVSRKSHSRVDLCAAFSGLGGQPGDIEPNTIIETDRYTAV